ncbi:MAG: hypothetical protein M1127_00015 [Patescibacteria group bacterium]|nr:hypothetical protein [Patescibacteria group bacterium]
MGKKFWQKGTSLYLTMVVLSALTATLLALVNIAIVQNKIIVAGGNSVVAFFAADAGIEQSLYQIRKQELPGDVPETVLGQAKYSVVAQTQGEQTIVRSQGFFRNVTRAIEAIY